MTLLPETREQYSSHIPALKTLINLGWEYLSSKDCLAKRGSNKTLVLKDELIEILKSRRYEYRSELYPLSANGITQIVQELSSPGVSEGLLAANEALYNKLTLGITVTEFIQGKKHCPTIAIIDWQNLKHNKHNRQNKFQVTEELVVLANSGIHSRRPDIVCYINGLPLVVIEAKRLESANPNKNSIDEGISQHIRVH